MRRRKRRQTWCGPASAGGEKTGSSGEGLSILILTVLPIVLLLHVVDAGLRVGRNACARTATLSSFHQYVVLPPPLPSPLSPLIPTLKSNHTAQGFLNIHELQLFSEQPFWHTQLFFLVDRHIAIYGNM